MRYFYYLCLVVATLSTTAVSQHQQNSLGAALNIDAPPLAVVNNLSIPTTTVITDSPITVNIFGLGTVGTGGPIVCIAAPALPGSSISIGEFVGFGIQMDLIDAMLSPTGAGYEDQAIVDGYTNPGTQSFTDLTGNLSFTGILPSCTTTFDPTTGLAVNNCIGINSFDISFQAIVPDPTNAPLGLRSTGAATANFINGFTEFFLDDPGTFPGGGLLCCEDFALYDFPAGFTFRFYGTQYTQCFFSSNGQITFDQADTEFPEPNIADIKLEEPRIASFYTDLVPEHLVTSPRTYAQYFQDANGVRKIKFVHERLAEFANATGPHGGEIIITENDDIAILVATYNALPSINTIVGISPGNNVDSSVSGFGVDLTALASVGPTQLGAGKAGAELFDHGPPAIATNSLDLAGFGLFNTTGVGPGIVFTKDPTLPNTTPANSGYFIQ